MMVRDVVLQRIPVMRERVIVMDLVMVVSMMVTVDVREILCVAVTTVSSLELTIIPRMTVVRNQSLVHLLVGFHLVELDSNQTVSSLVCHTYECLLCCRITTARVGDNNDDNIDV